MDSQTFEEPNLSLSEHLSALTHLPWSPKNRASKARAGLQRGILVSIGDRMSATATIGKVNLQKVTSFRLLGFKAGTLIPEIFYTNKIRTLKSINPVNFKFLHQKTKISKFCSFKGVGDQSGALKLEFFLLIYTQSLKINTS